MLIDRAHGTVYFRLNYVRDSNRTVPTDCWQPALGLDESTSSILSDVNNLLSIINLQVK